MALYLLEIQLSCTDHSLTPRTALFVVNVTSILLSQLVIAKVEGFLGSFSTTVSISSMSCSIFSPSSLKMSECHIGDVDLVSRHKIVILPLSGQSIFLVFSIYLSITRYKSVTPLSNCDLEFFCAISDSRSSYKTSSCIYLHNFYVPL